MFSHTYGLKFIEQLKQEFSLLFPNTVDSKGTGTLQVKTQKVHSPSHMKLTRHLRTGSVHYSQVCQLGEEGGKKGVLPCSP